MKHSGILVLGILLAAILLIPIPMRMKDGGSVEYRAILYCVTDVHRIDHEAEDGYIDGTVVKLLGMEIYSNME